LIPPRVESISRKEISEPSVVEWRRWVFKPVSDAVLRNFDGDGFDPEFLVETRDMSQPAT